MIFLMALHCYIICYITLDQIDITIGDASKFVFHHPKRRQVGRRGVFGTCRWFSDWIHRSDQGSLQFEAPQSEVGLDSPQ